jgi:hypothetical protein
MHKFRIQMRPHRNKDGTFSKTRKDYVVIDKTRGKRKRVGVAPSRAKAEEVVFNARQDEVFRHLTEHPNDLAFLRKGRNK